MQVISDYLSKKQHAKQAESFSQSIFGSFNEIMRISAYERVSDFTILFGEHLSATCDQLIQIQKDLLELSKATEHNINHLKGFEDAYLQNSKKSQGDDLLG